MFLLEKDKKQTNLMQFAGDPMSVPKVGRLHFFYFEVS